MAPKQKKALIDKFLKKMVSRKLLAWLVSTALCVVAVFIAAPGVATAIVAAWEMITIVYIGTQGALDTAVRWRLASGFNNKTSKIKETEEEYEEYEDVIEDGEP